MEVTPELFDLAAMQSSTQAKIIPLKFGFWSSSRNQKLIENNSNNSEENNEEDKEPIDIEFMSKKLILKITKVQFTLDGRSSSRRRGRHS